MKYYNNTKTTNAISYKYNYIHNHFTYYIRNMKAIANNVKLYNLGLKREQCNKAFDFFGVDGFYRDIDMQLDYLNNKYGLEVGFDGRNSGYLVLCIGDKQYFDIVEDILYYGSYKEYKYENFVRWHDNNASEEARASVEKAYEIVVKFDNLCDEMREFFIHLLDNYEIVNGVECVYREVKIMRLKEEA